MAPAAFAPSELTIDAAVDRVGGNAAEFQRLVERYARIRFPAYTSALTPIGRSFRGKTRRAPFDAEDVTGERIYAFEATHSPSSPHAWKKHLTNDIAKLKRRSGRIGAFIFVVWADDPPADEQLRLRARIAAAGVPFANVHLVFRRLLVAQLSEPQYARIWQDPLGLDVSVEPFTLIDEANLYGDPDEPEQFLPSREELRARPQMVHLPPIFEQVLERLETAKFALVRGVGAAGKTVLATSIAHSDRYENAPVYYIDLTVWDDVKTGALLDTLTSRDDGNALFVVDNVHLQPALARKIHHHWTKACHGSRLLMLGRYVTHVPESGDADPLKALNATAFDLAVSPADLLGVYRRLLRRNSGGAEIADPEPEQLARWATTFGGDLIAFSAAVTRRRRDLLAGRYERLCADDASHYVREMIVNKVPAEEREALLRLSVMAEVELSCPVEALGVHPKTALRRGVVICSTGEEEHRYRLVHPGLGRLILAGSAAAKDATEIWMRVARDGAPTALSAARALRLRDDKDLAESLLRALAGPVAWAELAKGVVTAGMLTEFVELGILTRDEVETRLVPFGASIARSFSEKGGCGAPLVFLRKFAEEMPRTYQSVVDALANDDVVHEWAEAMARQGSTLRGELSYLLANLPDVGKKVVAQLASPKNVQAMAEVSRRSGTIQELYQLLLIARDFIDRFLPADPEETAHRRLLRHLGSSPLRDEMIIGERISDIVGALRRARDKGLPELHEAIASRLQRPETSVSVIERAMRLPLHEFFSFVSAAETHLPELHATLIEQLAESRSLDDMVAAARAELAVRVSPTLLKVLDRLGRADLAHSIAVEALVHFTPAAGGFTLLAVSNVLRFTVGQPREAIDAFIDRFATRDYLAAQYSAAEHGPLTGFLMTLWAALAPDQFDRFTIPELHERLQDGLSQLAIPVDVDGAGVIVRTFLLHHILSTDAPAGLIARISGLDDGVLSAAATRFGLMPPGERMHFDQLQFWLGLRALSGANGEKRRLDPVVGEEALRRAERGVAFTSPRLIDAAERVRDWLGRCRETGWTIVPAEAVPALTS